VVLVFFWGQVAPQNDRVLVRLEQIPEVSPLSIVSLYYAPVLFYLDLFVTNFWFAAHHFQLFKWNKCLIMCLFHFAK
jgi:hypothetical protein